MSQPAETNLVASSPHYELQYQYAGHHPVGWAMGTRPIEVPQLARRQGLAGFQPVHPARFHLQGKPIFFGY
jgi:hypothetical protein